MNGNQRFVHFISAKELWSRPVNFSSWGHFSMEVEDSSLNGFPFTHSLLRGRWYWLILVWQSVVHARWLLPEEREVANLAAILVRLKHRARRQSYNKNQYHKLSVCHHLLTTAARTLVIHYYYGAVLAPAIIITKKYYRLQFEVEFAICSSHCLHLIKTQGTFCSYKERITRFPLTWPTWKMSWCWQVLIFSWVKRLFRLGALFWDVLC